VTNAYRTKPRNAPPALRLALLSLLALVSAACQAQPAPQSAPALLELSSFPRSELSITSTAGTQRYEVWLADTPQRETQGLMFVRDLPASQGMLFVNKTPTPMSMWMKNTYIPLDMLFIDSRGRILRIFANTTPHSLDILADPAPVKAVLELRGGECAARRIKVGDIVHYSAFRSGRVARPRAPSPAESR
jgi:uncharacterized membrane protein (UPF0127 family)